MEQVLRETIAEGFTVFKFKVGTDINADRERLAAVRRVLGYDKGYTVMIDANQVGFLGRHIQNSTKRIGLERSRGHRVDEAAGRVQASFY